MTITKKQLTDFIFAEVKKIIAEDNIVQEKPVDVIAENLHEMFDEVEASFTESEPEANQDTTDTVLEAKKLSEEFKRMKQLVDFRSPLLIKD